MYDNGILHFWNLLCDSHTSSKILHVLLYLNLKIVSYELVRIFQMFKLVLEKAEEPEIKLSISSGSSKKQESSRKTSISAWLTTPKPSTVWITINCGKIWELGIPDHLTCLLRNLYASQEATVRTGSFYIQYSLHLLIPNSQSFLLSSLPSVLATASLSVYLSVLTS